VHIGAGAFDPSSADPETFPTDSFYDNLVFIQGSCPGDLDAALAFTCPETGLGAPGVNGADLGLFLLEWSPAPGSAAGSQADLNEDGQVDGTDLGLLLLAWGPCPGACP